MSPRTGPGVAPLGHGSVSLGLSAVGEVGADVVRRLVVDARTAVETGFDGVTLSEHHRGFPGYVPDPLSAASLLLERLPTGWACAAPAILPLRHPVLAAEQLAWAAAAHPGRVAAAFVPGYQEDDFALLGEEFTARRARHWERLEQLVGLVGPEHRRGALAGDPAVVGLPGDGVPLLTGAAGPVAVRRAARLGVGVLLPSLRPPQEVRQLAERYADEGGQAPVVLIRRLHVGTGSPGSEVNRARWRSRAGSADWLDLSDAAVATGEPGRVAELLAEAVRSSGCTALNLRLECYADAPDQVSAQLEALGEHVLPEVRAALGR
ncbi:LLM class flavin-dependent oxidoreductase [Nocardioides caldifontis]|uniref:LLM class flavin-dependent oxidoreductase n=1 Tax=Nocardioides caldifontis TaxID=2588938 RepID=UPI0011DFF4F4|nr:LLM class flavin-dependent oxidoreductase [Nocardioides caldifontis]